MSSLWNILFSAEGDVSRRSELKDALPTLFHYVNDWDVFTVDDMLVAQVDENYGGHNAFASAVERFPNLVFHVIIGHLYSPDCWYGIGVDGKVEWLKERDERFDRLSAACERETLEVKWVQNADGSWTMQERPRHRAGMPA
jgi:hypothetical protein